MSPDAYESQWYLKETNKDKNLWTIQSKKTSKYARPQGTPAKDVSVVESDNSYEWKIVSANDGNGGNL